MQQLGALKDTVEDTGYEATLQKAQLLVAKAQQIEPFFQDFVRTIANKLNVHRDDIKFGSIKTASTIANKALYEKDGKIDEVKDILRATIEIKKPEQIAKAENLLSLMERGALRCISDIKPNPDSIKNTFNDASFNGFGMLKANFEMQGFHATEIQIRMPCDSKELERSHAAYQVKRACEHAFNNFDTWSSRLTHEEVGQLALYMKKKERRAGKEREKHNQLAHGSP